MSASSWASARKGIAVSEGGNDDDPVDPGGRTSRGVTQSEYDIWRRQRGLPTRDVWTADDAEVDAIFHDKYWAVLHCDDLPAGVDYCVCDFGINSGNMRSAWELEHILGTSPDGEIGPHDEAAAHAMDPVQLIDRFSDERLTFLKGLSTWWKYGGGWTSRVERVRRDSKAMAKAALISPPAPAPAPAPVPPIPQPRPAPIPAPTPLPTPAPIPVTPAPSLWDRIMSFFRGLFRRS